MAQAREKYRNLKTVAVAVLVALGVLAAAIIASVFALALAAIYALASHPGSEGFMDAWARAITTLWVSVPLMVIQNILLIALAVGFTLFIARGKSPLKELGLRPLKGFFKPFIAGMALSLLIILVTSALLLLTGITTFEATGIARYGAGPVVASFVALLVGTMFIAFGEEAVFRGFLQNYLVNKHGIALGLIVSSAVFTLLHVTNDPRPIPILGIFASGLLLGAVFILTRSLYASIGLHFLWDFMFLGVLEFGKPQLPMGAFPVLTFSMPGDVIVSGINLGRWDDGVTVVVLSIFLLGLCVYRNLSRPGRENDAPASSAAGIRNEL